MPKAMTLLPPLGVTARAVLHLLLVGPLQHERDLAFLLDRPARGLQRTIRKLLDQGLVGSVTPACIGQPRRLLYLTHLGMACLAGTTPPAATDWVARRWRGTVRSLAQLVLRLPTSVTIQELLPPLVQAAQAAIAQQYAPAGYQQQWWWVRAYHTTLRHDHTTRQVRADGVFHYESTLQQPHLTGVPDGQRVQYAIWMLLDPGVGTVAAIMPRLEGLYRFRHYLRAQGITAFPPVWIVTRSAYRASVWRRAARRIERHWNDDPLPGIIQIAPPTTTSCWPLNALAAAHPVPLETSAWTSLATGERGGLRNLFASPLPQAALPPQIRPAWPPDSASAVPTPPTPVARPRQERLEERLARAAAQLPDPTRAPVGMARTLLDLTRRQLYLLDLIAAHPLIALADLALFMECGSTHSLQVNYLHPLARAHLITTVKVPCARLTPLAPSEASGVAEARCVTVTEAGWHLLSAIYQIPHTRLASTTDTAFLRTHAATHGAHAVGVYRFFAWLSLAARLQDATLHRLLWWETGAACLRRLAPLPGQSEPCIIRPDGVGEYAWGTRRVRFWLEWDMATMARSEMEQKFRHYASYAASRTYWDEQPHSLPMLLVVVPSARREAVIAEVVNDLVANHVLTPQGCLNIRSTSFALLARDGPLAAIWWSHLPQPATPPALPTAPPPPLPFVAGVRPLPPYAERPPTLNIAPA